MRLAEIFAWIQHFASALPEVFAVYPFATAEHVAEDELLSVEQAAVLQNLVATCCQLPLRLLLHVLPARSVLPSLTRPWPTHSWPTAKDVRKSLAPVCPAAEGLGTWGLPAGAAELVLLDDPALLSASHCWKKKLEPWC